MSALSFLTEVVCCLRSTLGSTGDKLHFFVTRPQDLEWLKLVRARLDQTTLPGEGKVGTPATIVSHYTGTEEKGGAQGDIKVPEEAHRWIVYCAGDPT
ncbi:hypothetical protein SK128_007603 [Halocaridina rubra]|uniref:Uncharacterized protein n=1 Tax=Halocaridina rubra TaxID=373956 RepID=A0AAN8WRR4_HALRR